MTRRAPRSCILAAFAGMLTGCEGVQSALDPAGPQAALIGREMIWLAAMGGTVFVLVAAVLLVGVARRRHATHDGPSDRSLALWVGGATLVTIVVLIVNLVIDLRTMHGLDALARAGALSLEITGRQWWWEVEYQNADPSRQLITANEIHVPVGEPVLLRLRAADVIHSFWVPRLHGKRDLIPGHTGELWIQADEPGVYRGACAEFCGHQHAKMAILVVAEPRADFDRWYEAQLAPSRPPADPATTQGRNVFMSKACVTCHSIRGTDAAGRVAPDLTHVASRRTVAAGSLANTDAALRNWVVDPHATKPGVKMPPNELNADELEALLAYLRSLE